MLQKFLRWIAGRLGGTPAVQAFDQQGAVAVEAAAKVQANAQLDRYKPQAKALVNTYADAAASQTTVLLSASTFEPEIHKLLDTLPAAYAAPLELAVSIALNGVDYTAYQAQGKAGIYQLAARVNAAIDGARL